MPALPPYLPTKEADFNNWLNNFSTLISANPPAYGLMTTDAATIAAQNAAWTAAYGPVTSPATKTAQAVQHKNTAKVSVSAQIRTYCAGHRQQPRRLQRQQDRPGTEPQNQHPLADHAPHDQSAAHPAIGGEPLGLPPLSRLGGQRLRQSEAVRRDAVPGLRPGLRHARQRPRDHAAHRHAHEVALRAALHRGPGRKADLIWPPAG